MRRFRGARARFSRAGSVVLVLFIAAIAQADPVLHEHIPALGDEDLESIVLSGGDASAIVYDGEVLPRPRDQGPGTDEAPMEASPGDGQGPERPGARSPRFRPDRQTELEHELGYYSVFTPVIAPFKRISAFDAVVLDRGVPVLTTHEPEVARVEPIVGVDVDDEGRPRDRFWGSVVLDFRGGPRVPFPSVSPESRVLLLRAEPDVPMRLERDGADNLSAILEVPQRRMVRAIFLMDAPRSYFNTDIPNIPSDAELERVRPLPPAVTRRALTFASELGITRGDPLPEVLEVLTRHFRSFEESSDPPENTGDIFLDLARGMRGVCRHRAYGFVITLMALGVPARFVQNEAHAWAEVSLAGAGFMRVDLGGASNGLRAHGADDRPTHRPEQPDPLPRPPSYRQSYSQGANVSGLRSGERLDNAGQGSTIAPLPPGVPNQRSAAPPTPTVAPTTRRERTQVNLSVTQREFEVFRGRSIEVSGRARTDDEEGVEGLRVEVFIAGRGERLLGVTVTRTGGWFEGRFGVPPDLPVGEYRLLVRSPGSPEHAPATAN